MYSVIFLALTGFRYIRCNARVLPLKFAGDTKVLAPVTAAFADLESRPCPCLPANSLDIFNSVVSNIFSKASIGARTVAD